MPGRLFLTSEMAALGAVLGQDMGDLDAQVPRQNIAPGEQIVTLTSEGFQQMRWGIIPVGRVNARGRPVMETLINARSETVFAKTAFAGVGRAVVPANGWYEWTGEKRRKTAWRIRPSDAVFLWFAAITDVWKAPGGLHVAQVATVTCPPNADVAPIHHRMGVLLEQGDIPFWLEGNEQEVTSLMTPWPEGRLVIEEATGVDWEGA
ncbi:SOS response-associated peptidase [Sulfitobacter sp. TSTF-M16]|uniref:Abasic site processing protein n=1 Tax=Sulfitobacter aestuariivivens TaxID=2766981 RepID=A0A927D6K7_9RHOB|nr:SOS response-associated peptidase [Sulfitobacter aestuariivivens]MBD3665869.1 SOS response-associated peptidase [Sulfitobacter aestuariivivens]